jgi:hypothetical protein
MILAIRAASGAAGTGSAPPCGFKAKGLNMAALDTSAGNVALGQLSALPFKNIIGGPLTASIEAQALAAKTTVDFIRAVGLQEVNGKLEAINVEFSFQDGTGAFRRLRVPILTVIPIPFIVIETVDIQFKARIAASAQQASEDSSSTEAKVAVQANARWGTRGFGASVSVDASYSAKKDSKASQESKYSVEYTMDVHVHASQAGLPQGMAQILNILQDGISNKPEGGQIQVFGLPGTVGVSANVTLDEKFTVIALDEAGDPQAGTLDIAIAPTGVFTATPTSTTTNPATVSLAKDANIDLTALPQDVTITIKFTPTGSTTPVIDTRTVSVVAA